MYIEKIIFLNFIIDYLILKCLSRLLKINTKKYRIVLGSLFGEITIIYLFINMKNSLLFITKIIIGLIMIYISFGYNNLKTLIKNSIYYYLLSFVLGGFLYYLKIENLIKYKYLLLFIPIFLHIYEYFEYNLKINIKNKYRVNIYLNNGKILYLNGFMDTGNTLIEPFSKRKVIIINKKINEKFYLVPYETVNSSSLMKCFNPKRVYIEGIGDRNDISVGITNIKFKGFDCLLNSKLLEE